MDVIESLARDDKWYLGSGDGIIFAPPFPLWLDAPGFWDARSGLGHEAGSGLVVRCDHRPAALLRLEEHVYEIGVRDAEQGIDPLGFQQFQDALVDRYAHDRFHSSRSRHQQVAG